MKQSKSFILLVIGIFVIALGLLFIALGLQGYNIFEWLFSTQALLVLVVSVVVILTAILIWYKTRD